MAKGPCVTFIPSGVSARPLSHLFAALKIILITGQGGINNGPELGTEPTITSTYYISSLCTGNRSLVQWNGHVVPVHYSIGFHLCTLYCHGERANL